jgi:hypothetical protein
VWQERKKGVFHHEEANPTTPENSQNGIQPTVELVLVQAHVQIYCQPFPTPQVSCPDPKRAPRLPAKTARATLERSQRYSTRAKYHGVDLDMS